MQNGEVTAYPNPVEDYLEVRGLKDVIGNSQLIDMTGRTNSLELEKRDALPTGQAGIHRANVQHLSAGVYLLLVLEGKMIHQIKFIKK